MPKRSFAAAAGYRYGFNGKENDNEVKGLGNQQDYGMRIYDTRVGRFLSVDPLMPDYPWYSPYQFAGNTPIAAVDVDGTEPKSAGKEDNQTERAPDKDGKMQDWSWSSKNKVWAMILEPITVTAYSKKYSKPLSTFVRAYYDDRQWQEVISIGKDLANLLFLKELMEKMPSIPGMPDAQSTYEGIKNLIKDKELKDLLNQSEIIVKNREEGMKMLKEGSVNLLTKLVPVKKLGDALRLLDKALFTAGLTPVIQDYNLTIISLLDIQKTHLQFEYALNGNQLKFDAIYVIPVTYKQFCQIMNQKFFVRDDFKKQLGLTVGFSASNKGFQGFYFGGERPAYYLYFNQVGNKGFIHVSQIGVKPIK